MLGFPKRDGEWYPEKPTVGQVAFGAAFFFAVAGLALYWSAGEANTGNRIFLWAMAGLALGLGIWRIAIAVLLVRAGRSRRRASQSPEPSPSTSEPGARTSVRGTTERIAADPGV